MAKEDQLKKEQIDQIRRVKVKRDRSRKISVLISMVAGMVAVVTTFYAFSNFLWGEQGLSLRESGELAQKATAQLDSLESVMGSLQDQVRSLMAASRLPDSVPAELRPLQDSLKALSLNVAILTDAISPKSMTEVMTLQRIGDRYELLSQDIADLKADMNRLSANYNQRLQDYAAQLNAELDRLMPVIWGLLIAVVAGIFGNLWQTFARDKVKDREVD